MRPIAELIPPIPSLDRQVLDAVQRETERWIRKALENGAGWNVWRSEPETGRDPFVITHRFALVPPGADTPGKGYLFTQPDFTDGERARLLAGRHDWRESAWEDHCGVDDCDHDCCAVYWGRKAPTRL